MARAFTPLRTPLTSLSNTMVLSTEHVSRNITADLVAKCRVQKPPFRSRRFSLKAVRQKAVVEVCGFAVDESGQYQNEEEKRTVMNILERAGRQVGNKENEYLLSNLITLPLFLGPQIML